MSVTKKMRMDAVFCKNCEAETIEVSAENYSALFGELPTNQGTRDDPVLLPKIMTYVKICEDSPCAFLLEAFSTIKDIASKAMDGGDLSFYIVLYNSKVLKLNEVCLFRPTKENPICVVELKVSVNIDGEVSKEPYKYTWSIRDFFSSLHLKKDIQSYRITYNGETVTRNCRVSSCVDNPPIYISTTYDIVVKIEQQSPKKITMKLDDTVKDLSVKLYKNEEPLLYYYKDTILEENHSLKAFTYSEQAPLCIKRRQVTIVYEGKHIPVDISFCTTVEEAISKAGILGEVVSNVSPNKTLDTVIKKTTTSECIIYVKNKHVQTNFPISGSVSTVSRSRPDSINSKVNYYEVYSHWFAMEVYKNMNECHDYDDDVNKVVTKFQAILQRVNFNILSSHETTYTAKLSLALHEFITPDACCLHQPNIMRDGTPDFYFAAIDDQPILAADFNISESEYSIAESASFGYCMKVMENDKRMPVLLTIPGTKEKFVLYVCFSRREELNAIKIVEAKVTDYADMQKFFSALRFAVTKVLTVPIYTPFQVEPWKPVNGLRFLLEEISKRVCVKDGIIYKFFDSKCKYLLPNKKLIIETLGKNYLTNLKQENLAVSSHQYLSYTYIESKQSPSSLSEFKPIMEALDKLHKAKIVHSDVRVENLLFPTNGSVAKIIDFDLAAIVNTPYPSEYNGALHGRHKEAVPHGLRQIKHDQFSLIYIMKQIASDDEHTALTEFEESNYDTLVSYFK